MHRPISRRTFLRGAGVALALPWLEAMRPAAAAAAAGGAPKRLCFLFVPNGAHMQDWTPAAAGAAFELPLLLQPLNPVRRDVTVLTGLAQDNARAKGDGPGDHARSAAAFLTGAHPRKTAGADIRNGISVDQLAAQRVGSATRFASLELGCEPVRQSGNCDSGYSCAYSSNIAWRSPRQPVTAEINPRQVFDRLFMISDGAESAAERKARWGRQRSILDWVREDTKRLHAKLGTTDRRKLQEYQDAVREIEQRIAQVADADAGGPVNAARPPALAPRDYRTHLRLQFDLIRLAFQLDLTRVVTFMLANEGSNKNYGFIEAAGGHHHLSHHGGDAGKIGKIKKINRFHIEELARFLQQLGATQVEGGRLLDHTAVLYGSGISDGNRHNHDNLPILLAGKLGGTLNPGRHVRYTRETPLCNLFVSLLDRVGVKTARFGDSTGPLDRL
ncbi:MAG: DUF1552 domain-containing protein [Planctomycetota bacterium]|jgi:hypothetical protein